MAPLLERIATAQLVSSERLSLLRTSIPSLPVIAGFSRCPLAVMRELMHVVESCVSSGCVGQEATLTVVASEGFVTFAVSSERDAMPVLGASGAEALARLGRLAEACGGAVKREVRASGSVKAGVALAARRS